MISSRHLAFAVVTLGFSTLANAQQNLPRPIVLYRPPSAPAAVPRGGNAAPNSNSGKVVAPNTVRPAVITPGTNVQPGQTNSVQNSAGAKDQAGSSDTKEKSPEQEWAEQQTRPSNQALQNPSGAYNLSHAGISSSQQMAPNLYLGQQFQNWSNQQPVGQMPGSQGEMSRYQPGQFGGYTAPNTYLGSGFSNWSNLSQGGNSPGANGSWSYSIWP